MHRAQYASTGIDSREDPMSRLQLAINVSNLDEAIDFYSRYFNAQPVKVKPGYANFAIDEPPLKLVLMEGGEPGSINHLGVEVFSTDEVAEATRYLASQGLATDVEDQTTCCYAVQDKVWVDGPDGTSWETYVVLADAPTSGSDSDDACCSTTPAGATRCC
jgi:catechol 2,3-dioxygenase-like lactoylglutathione lyase family enzyme